MRPGLPRWGEAFERANSLIDECCDPIRNRRVLLADVLNDADKIVGGLWRPAELHLRAKHPFDTGYHFAVGEELSAVKLIQAFLYFLPKPAVMVQVNARPVLERIHPGRADSPPRCD
jgi:hypothetical protein